MGREAALFAIVAVLGGTSAAASPDGSQSFSGITNVPLTAAGTQAGNAFYLETLINEQPSGLIVTCRERGGRWWAPANQLQALGLRVDDLRADPEGWIDLGEVAGLSYEYDAAAQRMHLTVLGSRRSLYVLRRAPLARDGDAAAGALVNYDAFVEEQSGERAFRAYTEQRAFGDWGVLSNHGTFSATDEADHYVRLDTQWNRADPASLRSVSVGDFISRSLTWSRSTRLAGLQLRRNFALRPDLVTHPVAIFSGEAAVPSTIDLYVNQVRQLTGSLPAGPFRIETPPAVNGAGQATLVVRDVLGRQTIQTLDLYVVPQLLAAGLSDYALEAGLLRERYGARSADYREGLVGSASLRYGLSDSLTLESHAEAAEDLMSLGGGALFELFGLGQFNASLSYSDTDVSGVKFGAGYQYVSPRFTVTADWQEADRDYRDLPALAGDLPPRRQARVFFGAQLSPTAHVNASYLIAEARGDNQQFGDPLAGEGAVGSVSTTRLASLGYRQNLGERASMTVNVFEDLERDDGVGAYVGFAMALGGSVHMQSEYSSTDERSAVSLTQRSPYEGGWDSTLRASHNGHSVFHGGTRFTGDAGSVSLDVARDAAEERWQLGARGALVFAGDAVLAGRYVQNEFAVVSTDGVAGVPVLHENRPVGSTNADGLLLLANVNAYQVNRVAVDPLAIPFGWRLDQAERSATPRLSAGTRVEFSIAAPDGAVLTLVDASGKPLVAGSRGVNLASGTGFVVGYDGAVYLTGLGDTNRLRVESAAGACEAEFARARDAGVQPDLGRVICQ